MKLKRKKSRALIAATAVATSLAALPAVFPATSHANAAGYQYWGGFNANIKGQTVRVPGGQLHHQIIGRGYHVDTNGANFVSAANLCDSSMRFTYGNGRVRADGNVHWGCSRVGQWKYRMDFDAPRGEACAELWIHDWGRMITKQCHYIYG